MITNKTAVRVRFAPAPTGMMHLGNIRAALMNYLFAKQTHGTFILRIEDTDQKRNYDPDAKQIMQDLQWLGLECQEGPGKDGHYGPYFQSQRTHLYLENLEYLEKKGSIYRCFCSADELEIKRKRQQALHQPPRYDRTCLNISADEIERKLKNGDLFVWRVYVNHNHRLSIYDLARHDIAFDLKNFSDFPITRQDGSFTFIFANFVDDLTMKITHIFRGEDHLTNTACQAVLYELFDTQLPIFWHMPILCNIDGKKLSKRDFGFSLRDLKDDGFLPEAICNYLAIIGGSFHEEIMSLETLASVVDLNHPHASGHIKYDFEKLKWVNHQWIERYSAAQLAEVARPYLDSAFIASGSVDNVHLAALIEPVKTDLATLKDVVPVLRFYFEEPVISKEDINAHVSSDNYLAIKEAIEQNLSIIVDSDGFVNATKKTAAKNNVPPKQLFHFLRLALTGSLSGPAIHILIQMLGAHSATARIQAALKLLD